MLQVVQQRKDMWNADLYDNSHSFVAHLGNGVLEFVVPAAGDKVLDAGCGTGDLTYKIYQAGASVTGIDQSENMIQQAAYKYPEVAFKKQNILDLTVKNEFDTVFSNATLHWIKEANTALEGIFESLKPGGKFVAEFGGKGNVQTITDEMIHQVKSAGIKYTDEQFPWYFPSIGEYTTLMEKSGFNVKLAEHFDRPTPLKGAQGLRHWMNMFCERLFQNHTNELKEHIMTNVENNLKDYLYYNDEWVADYKRLRVVAVKNK